MRGERREAIRLRRQIQNTTSRSQSAQCTVCGVNITTRAAHLKHGTERGCSRSGGCCACQTAASLSPSRSASLVVLALASLVPSWHLKLGLHALRPVDAADGVRSVRAHVSSLGPVRAAPSQPLVRFDLPDGGLRLRGDVQLSLASSGGLVAPDDELGWVHVHTSWMPAAAGTR